MFRGVSTLNLDTKGRLAVPTRYRERLSESCDGNLILTVDRDGCLLLYPFPEWEEIERKLVRLSSFNKQSRGIQRLLLGHAAETPMDSQGRILVPAEHRAYADLDKRVVMAGQGKKFELWDEARWNQARELWLKEELEGDGQLSSELESLSI